MASVQVILREDVHKLGKIGQLVKVKPGFARNYLIPQGLAAVATEGNVKQIEHEQKAALARAAKLRSSAEALASKLSGVSIEVQKPVGEEGKLYGSVTTRDVVDALAAKGFEVDKKKIIMPDSVKALGTYEVGVKLGPDVSAKVQLTVARKE